MNGQSGNFFADRWGGWLAFLLFQLLILTPVAGAIKVYVDFRLGEATGVEAKAAAESSAQHAGQLRTDAQPASVALESLSNELAKRPSPYTIFSPTNESVSDGGDTDPTIAKFESVCTEGALDLNVDLLLASDKSHDLQQRLKAKAEADRKQFACKSRAKIAKLVHDRNRLLSDAADADYQSWNASDLAGRIPGINKRLAIFQSARLILIFFSGCILAGTRTMRGMIFGLLIVWAAGPIAGAASVRWLDHEFRDNSSSNYSSVGLSCLILMIWTVYLIRARRPRAVYAGRIIPRLQIGATLGRPVRERLFWCVAWVTVSVFLLWLLPSLESRLGNLPRQLGFVVGPPALYISLFSVRTRLLRNAAA